MNPVRLFTHSNIAVLRNAAQQAIKNFFCENKNSDECFCKICFSVTQQTHPSVILIEPKTSYTKDDLAPLHNLTQHARSREDALFFVLENPEFLLQVTANSLLKTLEEPPAHIFFLLLSQNPTQILPTISSRAEHVQLSQAAELVDETQGTLYTLALAACYGTVVTGQQIEAALQKETPDTQASMRLVDALISELSAQQNISSHLIGRLYDLRTTPPGPGSGKIFWRTLFMRIRWMHENA